MSKLFTVAGTSVLDGVKTYRFANDMSRVKVLERVGHTDVELIELPKAMSKEDAVEFLTAKGITADKAIKAVVAKVAKVAKPVKTKLPKVVTVNPRGAEAAAANAEYFIKAWFNERVTPEQAEQIKANW
jgi:hypothetical protein